MYRCSPFARRSRQNEEHNRLQQQCGPGRFIYGQNQVAGYKMGFARSDAAGCGWVAAYNTLIFWGKYAPPAEIIGYLERHRGLLWFGKLGIKPRGIVRFLRTQGCTVRSFWLRRRRLETVEALLRDGQTAILAYAWRNQKIGLHYVTVRYDAGAGQFVFYNEYNDDTAPRRHRSVRGRFAERHHMFLFAALVRPGG